MPIEFPAVADFHVLEALSAAAEERGGRFHLGIVQCKDSFYGQHAPERMPVHDMLQSKWKAWVDGGCLASEMESAALFVIAGILRARAGSVHLCLGNIEREKKNLPNPPVEDPEKAIDVAILAVRKLIQADKAIK